MYNYNQVKTIHLEITSRCQASCPMCVRNIQGGIVNPWLELNEITLEQFKQWFSVDFLKQLDKLYMCGNTGDPIVAKDTLKIFEYLREVNPDIQLSMNTNGSARSWQFWKGLAEAKVNVRFGIDGLIDTHNLYRIGTDWVKILDNAKCFIKAGGNATWDMLVFKHNEHQVDICRQMSIELGFKEFVTKNTSRFKDGSLTVLTPTGTTSHILVASIQSKNFTKKFSEYNIEENKEIHCKVKQEKSMYVSAHGDITACCWLDFNAVPPWSPALVDFKNREFKNFNLNNHTLEDIFDSGYFKAIEDSWSNPLLQCSKQCGKIDKFKEQF